jgi:hypothetical protein
MLGN